MKLALGLCSSLLLTLFACGSTDGDSAFPDPSAGPIGGAPDEGIDQPNASIPAGALNACATSSVAAVGKPVYLVFAYDQSGSMALNSKWTAAAAAMKTFFESPASKGINASLTLFPKYEAYPAFCDAGRYEAADVSVTALPSASFAAALEATGPQPGQGGTPTVAALTGTMKYAQNLKQTVAKDATVAVVMVTDGVPEVCSDKGDVGPATQVASTNAANIATYVVGVGDSLANLNKIAAGGGTQKSFQVSVGDPAKTQTELSAAIKSIGAKAVACDYQIPSAPAGQAFDSRKVNVQYTPPSGAAKVIDYDQACATGAGWRYDNAKSPTRVLACSGTCDTIKATASKVDIVFGCATQAVGVK